MKYILLAIIAAVVIVLGTSSVAGAAVRLPANPNYAALGDSVAAGAGLPLKADATAIDAACSRSASAYPNYVAAHLGTNVNLLACSGAKIDEGIYGPQVRSGLTITPQLNKAFSTTKPDLITVTIGANDARWLEFISKCYIATCGSRFDSAAAKVLRADLRIELSTMLYKVNRMSYGQEAPKVLVGGYYSPVATGTCGGQSRITPAEMSWIESQTSSLNQALRSVVPYFSYATYVPVSFTGHELCSSDPWVQNLTERAPLHPTATGQAAIAQAFVNTITQPQYRY